MTILTRERRRLLPAIVVVAVVVVAVAARLSFVDEVTSDYRAFLSPWYDALAAGGGFRAVGQAIGNYNPPYRYLLAAATYLPIPKIAAIKLVSIVFDVILAGFAGLIVRRRFGTWLSVAAFAVVLFAPTVLINSGYWGQCDSIYAAFCLGSLYFLLRGRDWWACIFFGLALSFKLQAVFFLPQMHERYFYLADVLTIVTAFYIRRFWPVAVAVSASSLLSYAPFLWRTTPVPLPLVAFLEFLAVLATLVTFAHVLTTPDSRWIRRARSTHRVPGDDPEPELSSWNGRPAGRPPSQA